MDLEHISLKKQLAGDARLNRWRQTRPDPETGLTDAQRSAAWHCRLGCWRALTGLK